MTRRPSRGVWSMVLGPLVGGADRCLWLDEMGAAAAPDALGAGPGTGCTIVLIDAPEARIPDGR